MGRARLVLSLALLCVLAGAVPAAHAGQWTERRVLNMTHQGGEAEHPSGTMYAFRESLALGADMLELDVQPTKDGHLVVLHDQSVARTTGVARSVYDMTLAEVQRLDAAFNFVPGKGTAADRPAGDYPLRGVRTGDKAPPPGYTPDDFRIPTLEEVLRAFPDIPTNIEIKGRSDADTDSFLRNADLLVALLKRVPHPPLVVVSFNQDAVDRFHAALPQIDVAPGIVGMVTFVAAGLAPAGTQALQVPPVYSGIPIMTPDFVRRAHAQGFGVHVWFSGQEESERVYERMLDMGVDGLMPAKPRALEAVLCRRGTPRPAGNPNHCGGGARHAAATCVARVRQISPVAGGRVTLTIARAEPDVRVACGGRAALRGPGRSKARYGSAPFLFPYGVRETRVELRVPKAAARRVRRGGKLAATAAARVDGQRRDRVRRVTLRR
ncbi:glycerophosphodiester phosphodiesterase family protein [Conexibacter sp. SYSU D00693]|uniref:glycerophosphodiester phosphodiesterase family protein n=1 Tax=Conexibacter sp. SYSU D00693 TaxID=2812560 RepID=UPI00196A45AD|nr:glycerophosphodiester phosphodiesterase family protein [Conexibacter sp. SYSU D00693]